MKPFSIMFSLCVLALMSGCSTPAKDSPQRADASGLRKTVSHDHHFHAAEPRGPLPPEFEAGVEAHEYARYEVAMAKLMPLAQQGIPEAQTVVGFMYANGEGVPRDDAVAVSWFRKAADQGYADGQANLAYMYANGRGVERDKEEAIKWYLYAAERGDAKAQQNLSGLFGRKPAPTFAGSKQGLTAVEERAKEGDRDAMFVLGHSYITGMGVRQNTSEGMQWMERAAARGSAAAQYRYGRYMLEGNYGAPHDENKGMELIRASAEQGYLEAKEWLAAREKAAEPQPTQTQ